MKHEGQERFYVEEAERPYTKYSPDELIARGYFFIGNKKDDHSRSTPLRQKGNHTLLYRRIVEATGPAIESDVYVTPLIKKINRG